jgi:hypothetical protein
VFSEALWWGLSSKKAELMPPEIYTKRPALFMIQRVSYQIFCKQPGKNELPLRLLCHTYLSMRKLQLLLLSSATTTLVLFGFASSVSAQAPDPRTPVMAAQRFDNDKESRYAYFTECKKSPNPDQRKRAYQAAKDFLRLYGGDNDYFAKEVKQFVIEYDAQVGQFGLYAAFDAKNYAKTFELGRPLLVSQPDNFFVLGLLSEAGYENSLAGNVSLNDETIDYSRRAIQLIEAGKVSKPDPFKNIETGTGFLNNALGSLLKDKSPVEAAAAFSKAVRTKSIFENDPLTYYRLGVAILKGPYAQLSTEYNDKYGAKQSSAEQRAALEQINLLGTRAIDAFARSVALSDPTRPAAANGVTQFTPEFRSKVLAQLTALYKSFHNDSDAGLNELISGVLAKPLP